MSRYYDPETGRFISPDAIEYLDPSTIGGLNLYSYCNNNPVMYVDPSGHSWESFWSAIENLFAQNPYHEIDPTYVPDSGGGEEGSVSPAPPPSADSGC